MNQPDGMMNDLFLSSVTAQNRQKSACFAFGACLEEPIPFLPPLPLPPVPRPWRFTGLQGALLFLVTRHRERTGKTRQDHSHTHHQAGGRADWHVRFVGLVSISRIGRFPFQFPLGLISCPLFPPRPLPFFYSFPFSSHIVFLRKKKNSYFSFRWLIRCRSR